MGNVGAVQPATAGSARMERPARVLLGWLTAEEAALFQTGRGSRPMLAEYSERFDRARAVVAERNGPPDQAELISEAPVELQDHTAALQEPAVAFFREGWRMAVADLTRVCALQQSVFIDQTLQRAAAVDPNDIRDIARISLPLPNQDELPAQYDQSRSAWIISSSNPNLQIAAPLHQQLPGGGRAIGFAVWVRSSYMQVALFQGRYILRDGYHRAYGLLARGINRVPVLFREFPQFQDLGLPAGLFGQHVYLGNRPPMLPDYLNDQVSETLAQPASQKMVIIAGLELNPLA